METTEKVNSEGPGPAPKSSNSSKSAQKDEAVSKPLAKDPILGKVRKILFGKLRKTNKRQDDGQGQSTRQRDLNSCQAQENEQLEVKVVEEDTAMLLETVPAVQAEQQNPEDSEQGVIEHCLSLPNILRQILEELSNKELIKLSLVNKLWNFEARSVLRDRGCLRARIDARRPECLKLVQLAADLQQMRVVPFTGAYVNIYHPHPKDGINACESLSSESLNSACQVILDRLPWKHLSLRFWGSWLDFKDCPAFVLVKRILEDRCGVLKELSMAYSDRYCHVFQPIFQCLRFPSLKVFKFNGPGYLTQESAYQPAFVKTLVSCMPNLEKLYMDGTINFTENIMEGSSAVLVATSGVHLFQVRVCETLINALRTESISFTDRPHNMELLHRFVPMVMQASHTTLKTLRMDLLFAVPLMCYGILLENVTKLVIYFPHPFLEGIQPHILAVVKRFDFTRVFPKLEKINIYLLDQQQFFLSSYYISAFVERGIAVAREAFPDRAINIRHLEFDHYQTDSHLPLIFLSQMFPHAKTLWVKKTPLQNFSFTHLWEHFSLLVELNINIRGHTSEDETVNLDSVFCGIFPEEVAELRAKDDEYLKTVNITPVMPSITCMNGLRLLTLYCHCWYGCSTIPTNWMFSKVTGLIGFSRLPDLSVKCRISRDAPEALDHMKPYLTVFTD